MVPEGWRKVPLDQVAVIQTGLAKGKKNIKDAVRLPYLRVANVQDGYLDLTEIKEIEVERADISRYSLRCGDVLLTEGGDFDKLGRGSIWEGQIEPCLHQNHVFVVRPHTNKLLPYFLSQQTSSSYGKAYFLSVAKQTTNLASINSTQLREFPVLLPPLEQQRKIADILSTWDEAIETLERLIKAKEKRKRALMQGLLTGKKRFKEFAGLEWQQTRLEEYIFEVTDRNAGGAIEQVLSITNTAGFVLPDEVFSKRVASKNIENYKVVRRGQFAYNPSRINVGSLAYLHAFEVGVISPMYVVFDVKSGLSKDFLFHWFGSDEAVKNIAQSTQGSVRDSVNYSALANFEIKVPKLAEQKAITHVLNLADAEISTLQRGLELYKRQKRGLMQELLTGKTRVKVDEVAP